MGQDMPRVCITMNDNEGAQFKTDTPHYLFIFCNKVACLFSIRYNLENIIMTRVRNKFSQKKSSRIL